MASEFYGAGALVFIEMHTDGEGIFKTGVGCVAHRRVANIHCKFELLSHGDCTLVRAHESREASCLRAVLAKAYQWLH